MELTSLKNIRNLLEKHGGWPKKSFGQNFLINKGILMKIIEAGGISSKDEVLEIGPGIGTLTRELAKKAKRVVAVEKDRQMVEILKETVGGLKNAEVVSLDATNINPFDFKLKHKKYKLFGNLPYYVSNPIIRKFLETEIQPSLMVFIIQKEVAQRICTKAPDMTLLSASVQFYAKPEIISYVSKGSFWPRPKVDGAIIKIIPFESFPDADFSDNFFKIIKAGFSQPRKQLINNLSKGLTVDRGVIKEWLLKNNISPEQRAETLKMEDWKKLTKNYPPC
ncbi:MAG: 16S rRNA (adenine(1518)-N(6)/adenine(1519)-N(6))-dimethyltransferase RsmA [Candidatus Parcubacteria bacterium]|nr:16S rRNA (adenine(1518)-N(6)/adenine(1519)-N(6))-dimethyltransferase RsmA [Candidatus Parcubacteria bacterium]